jgi:hypothetical protein
MLNYSETPKNREAVHFYVSGAFPKRERCIFGGAVHFINTDKDFCNSFKIFFASSP